MESFGAQLRAQREQHHVTLAVVAGQTKIKESLLESLERDDLSRWPQGIFRRAYIRAYATAVGLDPDVVVRQFLEVYPDPIEPSPEELVPPTRLQYLLSRLRGREKNGARSPRESALDLSHATPARRVESRPDTMATRRPCVFDPGLERRLTELAALCTTVGRAVARADIATALEETVKLLEAVGVILWVWDSQRKAWVSALAHGYPDSVLAQLPAVASDADNAIGSAFRSGETQIVAGSDAANGAVVAPLMTPNGCAGMLAIELKDGSERGAVVRAFAMILAAQFATLISIPAERSAQPHVVTSS